MIYALLLIAFSFRIADTVTHDPNQEARYRFVSFQILACAAPFVWLKLLTIFDQLSFFGALATCCVRAEAAQAHCRSSSRGCFASRPSSSRCASACARSAD